MTAEEYNKTGNPNGVVNHPITEDDVFRIGRLGKPHGVKGEISFQFDDDIFDRVDADYVFVRIDGLLVPFFMEEYRFRSDETALMKFEGIDSADAAAELTGSDVFFPRSMADETSDEQVSVAELIGYKVVEAGSGRVIGTVTNIDDATLNTLFEVETTDGQRHIDLPANADLVKDISRPARTITLVIPDGVLDL